MVTQRHIADQLGISISAVSAAFRRPQFVGADLRAKIYQTARDLGYSAHRSNAKSVGVVVPNIQDFFYGAYYQDIFFGLIQRSAELGIRLMFFDGVSDASDRIYDVQAIALVGKPGAEDMRWIQARKIPAVLLGCPYPDPTVPTVYFENHQSVRQLTEYAIHLGHQNFALFNGERNPEDKTWQGFYSGFCAATESIQISHQVIQVDYSDMFSVEIAVAKLLKSRPRPTIVMCASDYLAYYVYKFAQKHGLSIPDDLSVTGFDSITIPPFLNLPKPDLTTVASDRIKLGRDGFDFLLARATKSMTKTPLNLILPTTLKLGDSVRRINHLPETPSN